MSTRQTFSYGIRLVLATITSADAKSNRIDAETIQTHMVALTEMYTVKAAE